MTALATATLQRLTRMGKPTRNQPARVVPEGPPLSVQFNPTTLRITRSNNVDRGGATTGTQKVQSPSSEPAKLTFDLEFDTAEQSRGGTPVDVRQWTALIRQFVEPPKVPGSTPPPAVQFAWGTLVFNGIVDQVTEELDYFHADGTPLHAKVTVSISEQDFAREATVGPASANDRAAALPGGIPAGGPPAGRSPAGTSPGSRGTAQADLVVAAQAGESAQQLLSRLGLDPSGWRGAMSGLDSPLALQAGAGVNLGAEVRSAGGIGTSSNFQANEVTASPDEVARTLGVGDAAGGATQSERAGMTLAAAGGVGAAARKVDLLTTGTATASARAAFETPRVPADTVTDPRSLSYAAGVPLQARANPTTVGAAAVEDGADIAQRRARDARSATLRWRAGGECR